MTTMKSINVKERLKWVNSQDFVVTSIAYSIGLGNIWTFPYICYKNGGGAFLLCYAIIQVLVGIPLFVLEVSLGQLTSQSAIVAWDISPAFKGIGYAMLVINFFTNVYYAVPLAWAQIYMYDSLQSTLPWNNCNNTFNSEHCSHVTEHAIRYSYDPADEYFNHRILKKSSGINDVTSLQYEVALSMCVVWVICYFCAWKGMRYAGKIVYFTAPLPYIILTIMLLKGLMLQGSIDGIVYYLTPDFSRLSDSALWLDAVSMVMFTNGVAFGVLIAIGSYNPYTYDSYKRSMFVILINCLTSFYPGLVIFSFLGHLSQERGVKLEDVTSPSPGLMFIVYSKALADMPLAPVWSTAFFFMLVAIGIDTLFLAEESIVTVIIDMFPGFLMQHHRREALTALICVASLFLGLPMVSNAGYYILYLWDTYTSSGMVLLWVSMWESIAIAYIYGADKFYQDLCNMVGYNFFPWIKWCWLISCPVLTAGMLVLVGTTYSLPRLDDYVYPVWSQILGEILALIVIGCIPAYWVVIVYRAGGTIQERMDALAKCFNNEATAPTTGMPVKARPKSLTLEVSAINDSITGKQSGGGKLIQSTMAIASTDDNNSDPTLVSFSMASHGLPNRK